MLAHKVSLTTCPECSVQFMFMHQCLNLQRLEAYQASRLGFTTTR